MQRLHAAVLTCALGAAHLGCLGSYSTTAVAHPLQARTVAPNVVRIADEWLDEEILGAVDGTLDREASLVALDATRACFDVTVRLWRGAARWALAERELRVSLEIDGDVSVEPDRPWSRWRVVEEEKRLVGAGRICFTHRGRITRRTEHLELFVLVGGLELGFGWQLVPAQPGIAPAAAR